MPALATLNPKPLTPDPNPKTAKSRPISTEGGRRALCVRRFSGLLTWTSYRVVRRILSGFYTNKVKVPGRDTVGCCQAWCSGYCKGSTVVAVRFYKEVTWRSSSSFYGDVEPQD